MTRPATPRKSLLVALAAGALALAASGAEVDEAGTTPPASPSATAPAETSEPTSAPTTPPATDSPDTPTTDAPTPAAVTLTFDGRTVPIATACAGVDGAVLATTEGEVTISLVREEGVALRYNGEGFTAETDEVQVEETADGATYTATLSSDQVDPVEVVMTVAAAVDDLPDC